jgi:cytochrome c-type biogenesis protein CcmH/NrfG
VENKMKKISITFLVGALFIAADVTGQTVQDGINDYYAGRYKGAKANFDKLLAANPNNIDATYWLGQTYIANNKDIAGARDVYSKALMASANAPLLIVGMGEVELNENKLSEATQRFETAITMTRGKKGDDPAILNAIGRAITNTYTDKDKKGDINYAVDKLEQASQKDPNNGEIFLNLGNAYLKAKPGEGGGRAFENYTKATAVAPNFAMPYFRLSKLFGSQKNWELYEKYLNDAITKDPKFAPAYYELYYYKLGKLDFAGAQDMASKYIANSDPDPQADHFKAQTYWAEKKYDEAISISKQIITAAGNDTKARTYILLADSYLSKGDTSSAKQYIDIYFSKAKPEEITPVHLKIKGDIYLATPGQEDGALAAYMAAVNADTTLSGKIDLLNKLEVTFKARKLYDKQVAIERTILAIKPNPTLTNYFNATIAYYFATKYDSSRNLALKMQELFPNEIYGFEWAFNNSKIMDTVRKDSIAVPDASKLLGFSEKDTAKYKRQYNSTAGFLLGYYANDAKDGVKALEYLNKMLLMDPTNETLLKIKPQLEKSAKQPANQKSSGMRKQDSPDAKLTKPKETGTG